MSELITPSTTTTLVRQCSFDKRQIEVHDQLYGLRSKFVCKTENIFGVYNCDINVKDDDNEAPLHGMLCWSSRCSGEPFRQ